jgi:hypothetical protein
MGRSMSVIRRGVARCHLPLTSASPGPVATIGSPNVTRIPSCAIVSVSVCNGVESCLGFRKITNDDLWARSRRKAAVSLTDRTRSTQPDRHNPGSGDHGARSCRSSFRLGDTRKLGAAHRRPAPKLPDPRRALRSSGRPYPLGVYSHQASFGLNAASEERLRRISHRARPVRNSATGIRPTTK